MLTYDFLIISMNNTYFKSHKLKIICNWNKIDVYGGQYFAS